MALLLDRPAPLPQRRTIGRIGPAFDPEQPALPGFGAEEKPRPKAPELRGREAPPAPPYVPAPPAPDHRAPEPALDPVPADRPPRTLDDLLSSTWNSLSGGAPAACPVCAGELAPRWSAGAGVVGGRCRDCGTELS